MHRKYLLLFAFFIFLISCKQEVSSHDFRTMMTKQCVSQMAPVYLGTKDVTDEQLTSFCDCYIDYLIGTNDFITSETITKAMEDQGHVIQVLSECAIQAKKLANQTDSLNKQTMPDSLMHTVEDSLTITEPTNNQE